MKDNICHSWYLSINLLIYLNIHISLLILVHKFFEFRDFFAKLVRKRLPARPAPSCRGCFCSPGFGCNHDMIRLWPKTPNISKTLKRWNISWCHGGWHNRLASPTVRVFGACLMPLHMTLLNVYIEIICIWTALSAVMLLWFPPQPAALCWHTGGRSAFSARSAGEWQRL